MTITVLIIFGFTYVLIAVRRLGILPIGRPAGALLGAVLMVAVGALTPAESYAAIDHDTLALLLGMMLLTAELARTGFFEWSSRRVMGACRTPLRLLIGLSILSGVLSAFLVNDTVCLFLTPVVVATCQRARLPMGPYLLALATSANIGSAATLVGNPQNMVIGSLSHLSFPTFAACAAPAAIVGLLLNTGLLVLFYRQRVGTIFGDQASGEPHAAAVDRGLFGLVVVVMAGVLAAFFMGAHLGYAALSGAALVIVLAKRDATATFARVDWSLLVFFSGLFIVVAGLASTGLVTSAWQSLSPHMQLTEAGGVARFTAATVVGSNLVSNVPMVLLTGPHLEQLADPTFGWVLLAFASTVAGNLTLLGSVANIIVAEGAREHYELGFMEYLRFGAVSTLLVLAAGVPVVALSVRWFG